VTKSSAHGLLGNIQEPNHKPGMMAHTCNPSLGHIKLETSLVNLARPSLKIKVLFLKGLGV
jgi:hypothetical protein